MGHPQEVLAYRVQVSLCLSLVEVLFFYIFALFLSMASKFNLISFPIISTSFFLFSHFNFLAFCLSLKQNMDSTKHETVSNSLCLITFGLRRSCSACLLVWHSPAVGQPVEEISEHWLKLHNRTTPHHIPLNQLTSWKSRQHKGVKSEYLSTM